MSTSVIRQTTQEKSIPFRHIQDNQELSSTPGGTIYSTTPGGTRIVYERTFLLSLRNSPLSRTPPKFGAIPTFLLKDPPAQNNEEHIPTVPNRQMTIPVQANNDDSELFSMDI